MTMSSFKAIVARHDVNRTDVPNKYATWATYSARKSSVMHICHTDFGLPGNFGFFEGPRQIGCREASKGIIYLSIQ